MDAPRTQSIDEATRHLITLITDQMRTDSQQQTGQQQQATAHRTTLQPVPQPSTSQHQTAIQREMTRSFPGYFLKAQGKGRKRLHSPCNEVSKGNKTVSMQFYLLNKSMERTPTPTDELNLLLAGMGRRTVMLQDNADHSQITSHLNDHYPKLSTMTGGWLFHKALGGSGQRKLIVVPPEADGYNTPYLRSASGGGKVTLYIVPLQEELDTSPLPPDAHEFKKMPKATCQICGLAMPLQVLAVHVKACGTDENSTDDDDANSSERSLPPVSTPTSPIAEATSATSITAHISNHEVFPSTLPLAERTLGVSCKANNSSTESTALPSAEAKSGASCSATNSSTEAACPLCLFNFPVNELEIHASFCGESILEDSITPFSDDDVFEAPHHKIECLEDILQTISGALVTEGKKFVIAVSRHNMLERGLVQWQRQKKSSPVNKLKVVFLGEAGIDTGALSKEFLTEMVGGIERRFFEGGRPQYSLTDLDKGHFKTVGEIMAVSIAQGGPSPNFLMPWCYKFLCSGTLEIEQLNKNDLGDGQYLDLITQVESATESSITDLMEDILRCGYFGIVSMEKKDEIIRAITLHATLKLVPILQEIRKGLELYGLGDLMTKHPEICQSLFVPGSETEQADADFVISICQAEFSEKGSYREQVEVAMMNHLQDLLQEIEQSDSASGIEAASHPSMTPKTFLQWVTGQGHIPLLSQEKQNFKITVQFNHNCDVKYSEHRICYPTVAACSNTITLPVKHMLNYEDFRMVMMEAFCLGQEFLRI